MDEDKLHDESQPAADEAKAQRIEAEAHGLKWCQKHQTVVWFDEVECPVCKIQKEFIDLTNGI